MQTFPIFLCHRGQAVHIEYAILNPYEYLYLYHRYEDSQSRYRFEAVASTRAVLRLLRRHSLSASRADAFLLLAAEVRQLMPDELLEALAQGQPPARHP